MRKFALIAALAAVTFVTGCATRGIDDAFYRASDPNVTQTATGTLIAMVRPLSGSTSRNDSTDKPAASPRASFGLIRRAASGRLRVRSTWPSKSLSA